MERRKYLGRVNSKYVKDFTSETVRIEDGGLPGYAALIQIQEVSHPFMAGGLCLYDDGHSDLQFLPDGAHWQLSAIYDKGGAIIEWYFDITKKNAVDEAGNPYCDDLYHDAALMPNGQLLILDEDELQEALDSGKATQGEFDMAYTALDGLREKNILDVSYMETFCAKLKPLFK